MTHAEAIDLLVEQDVAKWGTPERQASRQLHRQLSHGRAVNALYGRACLAHGEDSAEARALLAIATPLLTPRDWRELRDAAR